MSEIKVNSIKGVAASAAAISVDNSNGTCTLASGSKLNNCTTDGTTNLTIADGNLVIGTSGHGIDFSATANSGGSMSGELFDDYEIGTFTPRLGGSNIGTYNVAGTGSYIKCGRIVVISIRFNGVDLDNNATGNVAIDSLPFTAGHNAANGEVAVTSDVQYHSVPFPTSSIPSWYIPNNSGAFYGLVSNHNGAWGNFPASDFHSSGVYMNFSATYFTT